MTETLKNKKLFFIIARNSSKLAKYHRNFVIVWPWPPFTTPIHQQGKNWKTDYLFSRKREKMKIVFFLWKILNLHVFTSENGLIFVAQSELTGVCLRGSFYYATLYFESQLITDANALFQAVSQMLQTFLRHAQT